MIVVASKQQARQTRYRVSPHGLLPDSAGSWVTGYMGRDYSKTDANKPGPDPDAIYPMAYLVEQDPASHLRPHFHVAPQFQVVVAGHAFLDTHPVAAVSVHYAAPYSAYGPIKAGPDGVHYLTLRNSFDPGGRYMPESRAELPKPRQFRTAITRSVPALAAAELAALPAASCETLMLPEADGLGVWLHRLPAGQSATGPTPAGGGGQHWVVLGGSLDQPGSESLSPYSCIFLSCEENAFTAKAGPAGAEILALQYPLRSNAKRAEKNEQHDTT